MDVCMHVYSHLLPEAWLNRPENFQRLLTGPLVLFANYSKIYTVAKELGLAINTKITYYLQ